MKKSIIIISLILIVTIIICLVGINTISNSNKVTKQENSKYEQYLEDEIYGTDVITLINKATSSNEAKGVLKDEKGFYINNNQNSITIDIIMITNEDKGKTTTYKMEAISKVGITEFIKNFNTAKFKCTKINYHKESGKIAHIEITQKSV